MIAIDPGAYMQSRRRAILCLSYDTNMLQVRQMLLRPACVRASFSAADERLAAGLHRRGVTLTQLERAIWLGSPASTSLYSTARPPCSSLACTILPGWWMKSRRPAWLKATGSMCNGKRNNWKGGGLPVGTAGQRQSKRNDGNEIMSNLPRILKGAPCFCVRGMATIFLYLGNFQPAELGNFQPAQTGEFSTGTDTVSPRTDAQRIAHR